jgi:alpha-ketoglutaric semialdehyde dehydrogenase
MPITGDILIGAQRVSGGDRSVRAVNPATGELLEPAFAFAGAAEVERACALARTAFQAYRETGLEERARFLETIAANIVEIGAELIERASAETGLPRGRIEGERAHTVGQLKLFADVARTGDLLFDESQDEFQSRDVR